jgi:Polysaccharide pyruvyl transferase.
MNKMKIGIITLQGAHNYGAMLQMYALQTKLQDMGCSVSIIQYTPKYRDGIYDLYFLRRLNYRKPLVLLKQVIFQMFTYSRRKERYVRFEKFIKDNLAFTDERYCTSENMPADYDAYIFGSDQIWNPQYTNNFDPVYFGKFDTKKDAIKLSYAGSFGLVSFSHDQILKIKDLLTNLDAVSVREHQIVDKYKEAFNADIQWVLDPTLLVDLQKYKNISSFVKTPQKYVLLYQVEKKTLAEKIAYTVAEKNNCIVIDLVQNIELKRKKNCFDKMGPAEFLFLINNAEFIVTTSFHGTAFSVIFKKQFCVVNVDKTASRVESLLEKLNLESRLISSIMQVDMLEMIDYKNVDNSLIKYQEESCGYLSTNLNLSV